MSSPNPTDLPPTGLAVGSPAPDFRLRDQFGQEVLLRGEAPADEDTGVHTCGDPSTI